MWKVALDVLPTKGMLQRRIELIQVECALCGKPFNPQAVAACASNMLEDMGENRTVHLARPTILTSWFPPAGLVKMNSDAGILGPNMIGLGVIFCDSSGALLAEGLRVTGVPIILRPLPYHSDCN
ncbi:hypothetical protein GH714_000822 [Hevea brasiliensis]|uniref:Uncharacterized protein n=1 Tax=Hevea brasiliensis TaxID=3981 RepID=A0A6A6NFC2_HEVBR|nr:hypothetical protein GH714_000822 [Hevea brasiliensis]